MDPDAEFNLLTTIYQSVVHDMKQTYPGWEQISQKAVKLGAQLKATAQCMAGFVEAMQSVSDHANNLKGASRDVGACITRVCIKQRSIENRMRSWADALTDEFALGLQQRGTYWKSRCVELDKMATKHVKKVRARKQQRPDVTVMNEQRDICTKVLVEQRKQFAFFINTLLPVLNAQMNMLDDGSHLRQVVESLDNTVKHVDTDQLVASIVADVAQGPDTAWKQCLSQAGQKWSSSIDGAGRSNDGDTYSVMSMRGGGAVTQGGGGGSSASSIITSSSTRFSKPPLQRRNSEKSIGQFSMSSPTDGSSMCLNMIGNGLTANSSSNTITEMYRAPPAYQQVINARQSVQRPQNLNFDSFAPTSCIGATPTVYPTTSPLSGNAVVVASSGSSVASTSALLISEACKEIDQLGSDLENYCALNNSNSSEKYYTHNDTTSQINRRASHVGAGGGDYAQNVHAMDQAKRVSIHSIGMVQQQQQQPSGVRMRTTSASRPPPPARRSSQITAATPTAPSVAEQRMNGSMAGSRQSLDSAGLYDTSSAQQYYQLPSFPRKPGQNVPPPTNSAAAAKFRI